MNDRLPTGECEAHFWADESRELIRRLDIINGLFGALKGTPLAFNIDSYYADLFLKCRDFLRSSGGKAFRGRGLGADIIKAAEKYAAESGVNEIWIHSQEQAAGFYSALGYKDTGIHDVEEGCPHILMKKVL